MALAQRATRALELARAADPDHTDRDTSRGIHRLRARLVRELTATLGVDPGDVVATADPDRVYGGYPGQLLTVFDDDCVYRFIPEVGNDDTFYLLGPCAECGADVPVAKIAQLADLGTHLTGGAPSAPHEDQAWDPNHRPGCPNAATD